MDIRNWAVDRIMQLPDCCFGRRWPVLLRFAATEGFQHYDISEMSLPEKCVLWELGFWCWDAAQTAPWFVSLKLGDQLPATDAEFVALADFMSGFGQYFGGVYRMSGVWNSSIWIRNLKVLIPSAGRRLVGRVTKLTTNVDSRVVAVISSFPTEVPDWLVSR